MDKNTEDKDRDAFQKAIENSENDFEKNLTYISAGALGLSLAFIEKIVKLENADHSAFLVKSARTAPQKRAPH